MPIEEIGIRAVRGIRQEIRIPLDGKSLVLRGDNGTGKSSIVAALMLALRDERGTDARGAEDYWHHKLESPDAVCVSLGLKGGGEIVVRGTEREADEKGDAVRAACVRSSPFLVRRQLLRILDDKPGDRFRYFESFFELEAADKMQKDFAESASKLASTAEHAKAEHERLVSDCLASVPPRHRSSERAWGGLVQSLAAWATELGLSHTGDVASLTQALASVEGLLDGEKLARRRAAVEDALAGLTRRGEPLPADALALENVRRLEELRAQLTEIDTSELVERAFEHFSTHAEAASCPVCAQSVEAEHVLALLEKRRRELAEWRGLQAWARTAAAAWTTYLAAHRARLDEARSASARVARASVQAWNDREGLDSLRAIADAAGETVMSALIDERARAEAALRAELAELPAPGSAEGLRALARAVEHASTSEPLIEAARGRAERSARVAAKMKKVHEAFRKSRQDVAKELLREISSLMAAFYEHVHPRDEEDEITGAPRIELQRHGAGTALVRGEFAKLEIDDPRWAYSDGHLDTVGICIFLALRRFRADRDGRADPKLMILDDIVLSVDLSHAQRLLDLLAKRFDDHQILMFTHNGAFFDICANRLRKFEKRTIRSWSYEFGVALGGYMTERERLEHDVAHADSPKLLAQSLMNFADSWLKEARYRYAIAVPAVENEQYTLTQLWQPFSKRIRDVEKQLEAPMGDLSKQLEALSELVTVRNRLAAHDNDFAKEFPLRMVRDTCRAWLRFVALLHCGECDRFVEIIPNHDKPERIRCRCEKLVYERPPKRTPEPRVEAKPDVARPSKQQVKERLDAFPKEPVRPRPEALAVLDKMRTVATGRLGPDAFSALFHKLDHQTDEGLADLIRKLRFLCAKQGIELE